MNDDRDRAEKEQGRESQIEEPQENEKSTGPPDPAHEAINQLSDPLTTTSTGQPPSSPTARGNLVTNAQMQMPRYQRPEMNMLGRPAGHSRFGPPSKRPSTAPRAAIEGA